MMHVGTLKELYAELCQYTNESLQELNPQSPWADTMYDPYRQIELS